MMLEQFHSWIENNRYRFETGGFSSEIIQTKNGPKPSVNLYLTAVEMMVRISVWISSEVDFEILNPESDQIEFYKYWDEIHPDDLANTLNRMLEQHVFIG